MFNWSTKTKSNIVFWKNIVENQTLIGTYLVTRENNIWINNKTYENETKFRNYLKNNLVNNFEILEYIEKTNELLKLENKYIIGEQNKDNTVHSFFSYIIVI